MSHTIQCPCCFATIGVFVQPRSIGSDSLERRVLFLLSKNGIMTEGVILNRMRSVSGSAVISELERLVHTGVIKTRQEEHPKNARIIKSYWLPTPNTP